MSFLLATLNPGGRTRRRRRRSRRNPFLTTPAISTAFKSNSRRGRHRKRRGKLTEWQKAVREHGGVMQAVRARRGGKHRKKRRSAISRRRLRSRSRRIHRRRPPMARVRRRRHRRHRMPSRGRGGRFVSRRHRRRRHRRNPVVPASWSGNPGRRRRRRRRHNPLFLSRRGFSRRKHRGYRRLHRRRRHPRYWHNPVLPTFAFNPRRRKHHRRRHHRRHHRRYHRNPVLPVFAFNPGGGAGDILSRVKSLIDVGFWTETGIPAAVGFFGSKTLGGLVHQYTLTQFAGIAPTSPYYPYTKALCDTVAGAGMAWGVGRYYSKKAGDAIWLGTVVNVAYSLLKSLFGSTSVGQMIGLSGMGDDMSDRLKEAVVNRVKANLGVYLTKKTLRTGTVRPLEGVGTYATVPRLTRSTYDPSPRGMVSDYDVTNTDTTL